MTDHLIEPEDQGPDIAIPADAEPILAEQRQIRIRMDEAATKEESVEQPEEGQTEQSQELLGDPNQLPPELKPVYDQMKNEVRKLSRDLTRGWKQKVEELARIRKELEYQLNQSRPQTSAPQEPPMPSQDDDYATYQKKQEARLQWLADQRIQEALKPAVSQLQYMQQIQTQAAGEKLQVWVDKIKSEPAYTEEVGDRMVELQETSRMWANALSSYDDLHDLYERAAKDVTGRKAAESDKQRKQTAPLRAVTRPVAGAKRVHAKKDWAGMTIRQIGEETERELGYS